MIHPLADVQSENIGSGTLIWQFAVVLKGAVIGENCNINCHTFIENDVIIGNNVTVKSGVYIWDGIKIEDDVFIGPAVVFTNDVRPRSKQRKPFEPTIIKKGASLGANTTILGGITIGEHSMTGLGSVVTKDIPAHALVYGNPAKIMGWIDKDGNKLIKMNENEYHSLEGERYKVHNNQLKRLL